MTAPELAKLTADELLASATDMSLLPDAYPRELMQIRGVYLDELHRRAQANERLREAADDAHRLLLAVSDTSFDWTVLGGDDGQGHYEGEFWRGRVFGQLRDALAAAQPAGDQDAKLMESMTALIASVEALADLYPNPEFAEAEEGEPEKAWQVVADAIRNAKALAAAPAAPPTPAAPVTRDAACAAISALRTADQRQDWTASREAQDKLVEMLTRTPAAPVNDADVEAAITELIGAHRIDAAVRAREADGVVFPPGFVAAKAGALRNLIARRVASAGAAPVDSEREAAIDQAIRHHWNCARSHARGDTSPQCVEDCLKADERLRALMRSAPPQGRGDDGMRLVGLDLFSLRDSLAADRPAPVDSEREAAIETAPAWLIENAAHGWFTGKNGRMWGAANEAIRFARRQDAELLVRNWNGWADIPTLVGARATEHLWCDAPAEQPKPEMSATEDAKLRELLSWADGWSRSDKHGPEWRTAFSCVAGQVRFLLGGNAADALSASAIAAAPEDKAKWIPCPSTRDGWICVRHDGHKGAHESVKRTRWPNDACTVCKGTGQVEGTAGVMIGGKATLSTRLCPECSTSAMDRLKAKLAAAPEAPAWRENLDAAAAEFDEMFGNNGPEGYQDESLDGVDEDLRTVRDFVTALREQVESHARRIEALERANNKEASK